MLNVGLIGYGYWGPNLFRNFMALPDARVTMVSDVREARTAKIVSTHPTVRLTTNADDLIASTEVDAVVISTPVFTHYALAKKAILAGKHVLVEKPMTARLQEAEELVDLAARHRVLLMVDHTFLYHGAVRKMKEIIDSGELGNLKYFDSTRINLGLFQPDINVLWDLAPHDLSILLHLHPQRVTSVNATGISHTRNGVENIAYLTLNYSSSFVGHVNCSWTSPVKIRMSLIGGDVKMLIYNDLEASEKIKIYDTSYNVVGEPEQYNLLVDYRVGDIRVPKTENTEALLSMARDFVGSIDEKRLPVSSAALGLEVVRILEASSASLRQQGMEVVL